MMPGVPPALAATPQFDPKYWDKVPRSQSKAKLARITDKGDGFTEFVLDDGRAFQRRQETLDPKVKLHVNLQVFVEVIGDSGGGSALVTGMWVPNVGWAFRMTSYDLAEYTKGLTALMHKQRERARGELKGFITLALEEGIKEQTELTRVGENVLPVDAISLDTLAGYVMDAMETVKSAGRR